MELLFRRAKKALTLTSRVSFIPQNMRKCAKFSAPKSGLLLVCCYKLQIAGSLRPRRIDAVGCLGALYGAAIDLPPGINFQFS